MEKNFNSTIKRKDGEDHQQDKLLRQIISRLPANSLHKIKLATRPRKILSTHNASEKELLANSSGFFYKSRETKQLYIHQHKNAVTNFIPTTQLTYNFMSAISSNHVWTPNITLDFLPCYPNFGIRSSCNGLLLCSFTQKIKVYVCNPLMRRWVSIPSPKKFFSVELLVAIDQNHFKVLGFFKLPQSPTNPAELEIFSSKTWRWDKVELGLINDSTPVSNWNARFCAKFAGYLNSTVYATISPQYLISIPLLEGEQPTQYQLTPLPELCDTTLTNVSNGRLYHITNNKAQIRVWILKNGDNHTWVLKRSVSVSALADLVSLPNCYKYFREKGSVILFFPLAFDPRRSVVYLKTHCMLWEYDWEINKAEEVKGLSRHGHPLTDQEFTSYSLSILPYSPCANMLRIGKSQ